jgi:SAM-dependent methyltransferase
MSDVSALTGRTLTDASAFRVVVDTGIRPYDFETMSRDTRDRGADDRPSADERVRAISTVHERIRTEYSGYQASGRKRRAWAVDNPGNRQINAELSLALRSAASLELRGTGSILEVGCGSGTWLRELAADAESSRLYGVDLLEDRLETARRLLSGAHYAQADGRSLPFGSNEFALVLLINVLQDLSREDGYRVLAECRRVLAPEGLLLIYALRLPNPFNRYTRRIARRDISLPATSRPITLLPPFSRRLGRLAPVAYPVLARISPLRSHRLWSYRKPGRDTMADAAGEPRA